MSLGWCLGKPLTLLFDPLESVVMFLSGTVLPRIAHSWLTDCVPVIVVNYTVQDGKANWMEGAILMYLYIILAVIFWYYPGWYLRFSQRCLLMRPGRRCEHLGRIVQVFKLSVKPLGYPYAEEKGMHSTAYKIFVL